MDGIKKTYGRKKAMYKHEHAFDPSKLKNIEVISNDLIKQIIILLGEMYSHMADRVGVPDFDHSQKGRWGSEGGFSIFLCLNFTPYEQYGYVLAEDPEIAGVSFNTELLARKDQNINIQNFKTLNGFYNQVKNWHAFEMNLPLEDKTNYFYYENEISKTRKDSHEHPHSHPHD